MRAFSRRKRQFSELFNAIRSCLPGSSLESNYNEELLGTHPICELFLPLNAANTASTRKRRYKEETVGKGRRRGEEKEVAPK